MPSSVAARGPLVRATVARMRRGLAVAAALVAGTVAAQGAAAPSLSLDYEAPPGCPTRGAVFDEVRRLRGALTAGEEDADVRAKVRVSANGPGWSAVVETFSRGGSGRRTLEADTCQHATAALAVVLCLALANPSAPPAPSPEPVAAPVTVPAAPVEPPRVTAFIEALGGARFGLLPSVMPLAQLGGGVQWRWLRVEARLGLSTPSTIEGTAASADVESWFNAALGGCAAVVDAAARLELCVGLESALVSARGRGIATSAQGSALWLAAVGGVALRSQLWRGLGVVLDTAIGGALARPRFFINGAAGEQTVYESPVLTGRLGLGLQWRW